tara:strand:- start:2184 stop:3029 length:846 start_codon:yes stop_codon:yes gene_type:complete
MYYPPSQIVTNQFTSGGEFSLEGENYQGSYWYTSDGKFFTGKSPQDNPTLRLQKTKLNNAIPKDPKNIQSNLINSKYNINPSYYDALGKPYNPGRLDEAAPQPPLPQLVIPTEKDYELGEFQRYFAKKNNERKYVETSKSTYQGLVDKDPGLQWDLYTAVTIPWTLDGEMKDTFLTNKRTVELVVARSSWFGFTNYFRGDYLQYFQFSAGEGLFTDGTEFVLRSTGNRYKGFYHIHPTKGPMEGKQHRKEFHDFLDPITESLEVGTSRRTNRVIRRTRGGY